MWYENGMKHIMWYEIIVNWYGLKETMILNVKWYKNWIVQWKMDHWCPINCLGIVRYSWHAIG